MLVRIRRLTVNTVDERSDIRGPQALSPACRHSASQTRVNALQAHAGYGLLSADAAPVVFIGWGTARRVIWCRLHS
jgi:hypothetical protein